MAEEQENTEGGEGYVPRAQIRDLEQKAKRATDAETALAAAQRELAFVKAGVDTSTKAGQLLFKAYDGDLSVDAIKAEAAELGLVQPAEEAPAAEQVEVSDEEREAANVSQETSRTSPADVPQGEDPRAVADQVAADILAAGGTREDAVAASISVLGTAAASGDNRVLWNPAGT